MDGEEARITSQASISKKGITCKQLQLTVIRIEHIYGATVGKDKVPAVGPAAIKKHSKWPFLRFRAEPNRNTS